ncbi:MAG: dockerin type I repeat-containing protein, partial [Clostridia bacterium]|nr:dockerin type I repeat-containing protein [Clostridia bacterium]
DMEFEAGSNVLLFFNGPNPNLSYANTYISLTKYLKAAVPSLQISDNDIMPGQSVYTTLALEDIIPSSFIASDGTVVFTGVKIFVVGSAHKKVTLKELSVTTTDASVVPETPDLVDADSLLPTSASQISQVDGKVDFEIQANGTLKMTRSADSAISWPSIKIVSGKKINLSETPYLHLNMMHVGGWANGLLYYTNAYGVQNYVQLSQLVSNSAYDFCEVDMYVNLAKVLGTTGVITLDYYTLSVYGVGGDAINWYTLSTAKEYVEPERADGDTNGDGIVNTADAAAIFRHVLGTELLDATSLKYSDYNGDGTVSSSDVRKILQDLVNA